MQKNPTGIFCTRTAKHFFVQKKQIILFFIIGLFLISLPEAFAVKRNGKTALLAVSDTTKGVEGAVAELELELINGIGRVFLETYPLTKADTQISMRFAKQVACNLFNLNCDRYDFIFTIRAPTGIIGGPSAGAAAAALIVAMFKDIELKKDVAVTGTINSGGIIGGVGGLDKKIQTAKSSGIKKVLIPLGKRLIKVDDMEVDLIELGEKEGIEVRETATLHEALEEFTGTSFKEKPAEIAMDKAYESIMSSLADGLCKRGASLKEQFELKKPVTLKQNLQEIKKNAKEFIEKAKKLDEEGQYYSAASFCFRANINYGFLNFEIDRITKESIDQKISQIKDGIEKLTAELEKKPIKTITELQTAIIVKERLIEANDHLEEAKLKDNNITEQRYMLSVANERLFSALSWNKFFIVEGKRFNINKETLKSSCEDKIREAEERLQYSKLYIPIELKGIQKEIERAYDNKNKEEYEQCLFKASKAKAEANMIINLLGVEEELVKTLLEQKLEIAKNVITKNQQKGIFPILGYSYYEYSKSLKDESANSALLFTEYVLELSHFDIYFKETGIRLTKEMVVVGGLLAAAWAVLAAAIIIVSIKRKRR